MFSLDEDAHNDSFELNFFTKFPATGDSKSFTPQEMKERATYGLSLSDNWNSKSSIYWLYAEFFRKADSTKASLMLESLMYHNEYIEKDTLVFSGNKFERNYELHKAFYGKKAEEAIKIWAQYYSSVLPSKGFLNLETVQAYLQALKQPKLSWKALQGIVSDPIKVDPVNLLAHHEQRGLKGYSEWDMEKFPTFISWILIQAAVFLTSTDANGYPAGLSDKIWHETLYTFIEGLLYGFLKERTPEQEQIHTEALHNILNYLPDFWD